MASEHLRLMQRCGFLTGDKEGRKVYYRVAEPHWTRVSKCIEDRFGVAPADRQIHLSRSCIDVLQH
jgi:hypothetical protein